MAEIQIPQVLSMRDPTSEVDPYPVAALGDRYNLKSRQGVYDRLAALNIKPIKQGKESFISLEDLYRLDTLDDHLKRGGKLSDFQSNSSIVAVNNQLTQASKKEQSIINFDDEFKNINNQIDLMMKRYKTLQWLALNQIEISSNEIFLLLNIYPPSSSFKRGSFYFKKVGRIGNQNSWEVVRDDFREDPFADRDKASRLDSE